jgi:hypothetical protein
METRKSAWTYGRLLRTALLLVAAAVAAHYNVTSVKACTTCHWDVNIGYWCGGAGMYDSCTITSPQNPCELVGEGCIE